MAVRPLRFAANEPRWLEEKEQQEMSEFFRSFLANSFEDATTRG
jgi:hypothetical protein